MVTSFVTYQLSLSNFFHMKNKSSIHYKLFALAILVLCLSSLNSCEKCYTCTCYYIDGFGNLYESEEEVCGRDEKNEMEDEGCDCK